MEDIGLTSAGSFEFLKQVEDHNGSSRIVHTSEFKARANEIYNFEVRPDDIWVCSFPRSGTTWTQELVWMITKDCNLESTKTWLQERFPWFELTCYPNLQRTFDGVTGTAGDTIPDVIKLLPFHPGPRFIKCHLPVSFLPRQCLTVKPKIIYVYRDPRDSAISNYYLHEGLWGFEGSLENYLDAFLEDKVIYSPYWENVLSYWNLRNSGHVLFIRYSDMKKDLSEVVKTVAKFLGKEMTEEKMEVILDYLKIENMKNNPSVQMKLNEEETFVRQGNSGSWKDVMSEELAAKYEKWIERNIKGTDFIL